MKDFIYETMYILRPDLGEEQLTQAIEKFQNILREQGAELLETQHRGRRRLAYEILKHREGIYIQMNYKAPGEAIALLEKAMRYSEDVLRFLTVRQEIVPAKAQPEEPEPEVA
jgi:small subunit ribosomal protein S6